MGETNKYLRETHNIGPGVRERIVSIDLCPPLRPFGIALVGATDAADAFRFVRLRPRFAQLLACLSGAGRIWCGDDWVECAEGSLYLTPPGQYHAYEAIGETPWSVCWIQFLADDGNGAGGIAAFPAPRRVEADASALASAVEGLYREAMGAADPAMLRLWSEMTHAQAHRLLEPERMDPRLRRALDTMEARLDRPWTVADLARGAGLSPEHVRRLCRLYTGRSPMRHLTHLRMRHAAALLSSGSYSVGAVAAKVGYTNDFAFSTAFRRTMGRPPSAFRGG